MSILGKTKVATRSAEPGGILSRSAYGTTDQRAISAKARQSAEAQQAKKDTVKAKESGKSIVSSLTPGLDKLRNPTKRQPIVAAPANNPFSTIVKTRDTLQKASAATGNTPSKKPLLKRIVLGAKNIADKTGVTKDLGILASAAGSVLNAPGDLIHEVAKHTDSINNALYDNPVFHTINNVLPHAPAGPAFADGGTVGQHLQQLSHQIDIPGVTTGPAANFIRGAADTLDFGTGKALDQALGNTDYLAGRDTNAARAGEIASLAFPLVGAGAGLIKKGAQAGANILGRDLAATHGAIDTAMHADLPANVTSGGILARASESKVIPAETAPQAVTQEPTAFTQVNAPSSQPVKQNWFTSLFGDKGVGISPVGTSKRLSKTPLTSEGVIVKKAIKEDRNGIKDTLAAGYHTQYQNYTDMLDPLKHAGNNVYDTAMDSSRANQLANNIVGKDFVTPEGVRIGDGMETLFKKVPRGQDTKFIDYLILRDAESRIPRGERVYHEDIKVPNPDNPKELIPLNSERAVNARRLAMEQRYPWMATLGGEWNQFTKNLREVYGVNEGILSKEASAGMELSRPNYIKMMREFSRREKPGRKYLGHSSGQTFSGLKAPIKSVSPTGSARNIVDPRKTMAEYVGAMVNNAMRNRAMQKLYQNVVSDPKGMEGIARIVPDTAEATKKSMDEINKILETDGMDGLIEKMNNEFEMAFKKAGQNGGKDNIVTAMIDGHPVKLEIMNPEVATAIQGMNPTQAGIVTEVAQKMSNAVKRSATGPLAPLFAAKSVTMDLSQALIQSENPIRFIPDYIHAVFSSVADRLKIPDLADLLGKKLNMPALNKFADNSLARGFRRAGGGYSAALRGERGLNKTARNLQRPPILSARNIARQTLKWNPISASFKAGEGISNIFENAPRMAAAKGKLRQLGGEKTPGNVRQAMNASREITVNYSRKGRYSKDIEAFFPYSNAAMQSLYRVTRQIKKKPLQTAAALTVLSVLPKMYEYSQFHDDPDYQNLPARERFRNIIVSKNADGTFNKIPMDQTYSAIGEMTIETLRHFKDKDPNAFKGSMDALSNALLPPAASGALQGATQGGGIDQSGWGLLNASSGGPAIGALANQSFTGAPIEPMKVQDRSPQYRYDEKTSGVAKWLGDKLRYSPMKVDYIMRQYGGDASRILLPLTSKVGAGTPKNTLLRNFIVDPVFTNNLTNDYYQGQQLITQAFRDNQEVGAPLPKWFSDDLYKLMTSKATGKKGTISVYVQLKNLSDQKKTVQVDKNLTASQKAQKMRDIQRKMNEIYIDTNTRMESAGVPLMRH